MNNRQDKIKALVDVIVGMDYGQVITHTDIEEIIRERKWTNNYRSVVVTAKKQLLNGAHMIESVHGVGYKVVRPDDYVYASIRMVRQGAKRINNGARVLTSAPVNDMTQSGREAYNRVSDRMQSLRASIAGANVEINMLSQKREHPLLAAVSGNGRKE